MRTSSPGSAPFLLFLVLSFASVSVAQTSSTTTQLPETPPNSMSGFTADKPQHDCNETAPVAMLDQWNRLVVEYFDAHTGGVCRETNVTDGQFVAAALDSSSEILFGVRGTDLNLVTYSLADGKVRTLDEAPIDALAGEMVLDAAHHWLTVGTQQFFYDEEGRLYRMEDDSPVEMIKS
jgi:hypothetical protein